MIKLIKSPFCDEAKTRRTLAKFIVRNKRMSFGPQCETFEERFAAYQGRKHCVMFNSGSSANLALIQALLNLGMLAPGDPVGFSATTWSTNVMPLIQLGLKPLPVDIEIETLNVRSDILSAAFKRHQMSAFFLTNALGFCSDIDEIKKFCDRNAVLFLEDNCEALGSEYAGKKLGNFGFASTFSFYLGHHLSAIEGGAICTDSERMATMLRIVRAHGWDRNIKARIQKKLRHSFGVADSFYAQYAFYDLGYNLRPIELQGFLGNIGLRGISAANKKRMNNFIVLAKNIYRDTKRFIPFRYEHMDFVSNFNFPVLCRSRKIRDEMIERCRNKIEIRPIIAGDITRQPFFKKYVPRFASSVLTPNAKIIHEQGFYLGNNPEMTDKEIKTITDVFAKE